MSDELKHIPIFTRVRTRQPDKKTIGWTEKAFKTRRWGATGEVIREHTGHALPPSEVATFYAVRHDDDHSIGYYEPHELRKLTRGFLLAGTLDGKLTFRVYGPNHSAENHRDFVDYHIRHHDLEIEILNEHVLTEKNGVPVIDHEPRTLGKKG